MLARLQFLGKHDEIDGMALVVQGGNGMADFLMRVEVEVVGPEDLQDIADDDVIAQHAAEHALLRLLALRRQPIWPSVVRGHGKSW